MQEQFIRTALRGVVRDIFDGFVAFTRNSLALVGFAFVATVLFVFMRAESIPSLKEFSLSELTTTQDAPTAAIHLLVGAFSVPAEKLGNLLGLSRADAAGPADSQLAGNVPALPTRKAVATVAHEGKVQQAIARYLSGKYRISNDAVKLVVSAAYETGREMDIEPTLLLAVMAIESGFNPFAESVMGAQGLMQVMSKIHRDKFESLGGIQAALNPVANMKVGALILKDCIRRGGSTEDGLRLYVGAGVGDDGGYGAKVLQEKARIAAAAGLGNMRQASAAALKPVAQSIPSVSLAPEVERMTAQLKAS